MTREPFDPGRVTAQQAIQYVAALTEGRVILTEGQIRNWAYRGKINRTGQTHNGRVVYDLDSIVRRARRLIIPQ